GMTSPASGARWKSSGSRLRKETKMPYTIQFIGLAHFKKSRETGMRVLLPDGRSYQQIAPHRASISVAPDAVESSSGWGEGEVDGDRFQTEFWFPPSFIAF